MKPARVLIALAAIVYAAPPLAELGNHVEHHVKRCSKKGKTRDYGRFPFANETYNQLTDGTPCRDVTMIYARGSKESGNVGKVNTTGPALFNELADRVGLENLAVQGVTYKARRLDYIFKGGCNKGSRTMAGLIVQAANQCPDTKIVIAGYSQGAQVLHKAAKNISVDVTKRIAAGVTFGHEKKHIGRLSTSRSLFVCKPGDNLCDKTVPWRVFLPTAFSVVYWLLDLKDRHGDYNENATVVADWITERLSTNADVF